MTPSAATQQPQDWSRWVPLTILTPQLVDIASRELWPVVRKITQQGVGVEGVHIPAGHAMPPAWQPGRAAQAPGPSYRPATPAPKPQRFTCPTCKGDGQWLDEYGDTIICSSCHGDGMAEPAKITKPAPTPAAKPAAPGLTETAAAAPDGCPACGGSGRLRIQDGSAVTCPSCNGTGRGYKARAANNVPRFDCNLKGPDGLSPMTRVMAAAKALRLEPAALLKYLGHLSGAPYTRWAAGEWVNYLAMLERATLDREAGEKLKDAVLNTAA